MASDRTTTSSPELLALGPASRLVGVDPDTLRRWADAGCGRVYWRGAHSGPLESVVRRAEQVLDEARQTAPRSPPVA